MKPYKINLINSAVFIVCGMVGFVSHYVILGAYEQTALIPSVCGMLLFVMSPSMKNGSVIISRMVTALTLLFGIIVSAILISNMGSDGLTDRKMILLSIIALSSFVSLGWYLNTWMAQKREEDFPG